MNGDPNFCYRGYAETLVMYLDRIEIIAAHPELNSNGLADISKLAAEGIKDYKARDKFFKENKK